MFDVPLPAQGRVPLFVGFFSLRFAIPCTLLSMPFGVPPFVTNGVLRWVPSDLLFLAPRILFLAPRILFLAPRILFLAPRIPLFLFPGCFSLIPGSLPFMAIVTMRVVDARVLRFSVYRTMLIPVSGETTTGALAIWAAV